MGMNARQIDAGARRALCFPGALERAIAFILSSDDKLIRKPRLCLLLIFCVQAGSAPAITNQERLA